MVAHSHPKQFRARLELQYEDQAAGILSRHRDTPLKDVVSCLGAHPYVIATDEHGRLAGLVSAAKIRERLSSSNEYERARWQDMPLSSLLNVTFSALDGKAPVSADNQLECIAVAEGDRLFGIAVDDDVFLSWRRLESLLSIALSDPLTGLFNRLSYERRLLEEWNRSRRTETSVGVVVVDLDRFKQINDTRGHPVGDDILQRVGKQLEMSMRSYDLVARFGGDEFVALCLGCSQGDISIPVARIQEGIGSIQQTLDGQPVSVTASVGAAVRHDGFELSDPRELFSAADECLYHAKASADSAWKVEFGTGMSGIPEPIQFPASVDDGAEFAAAVVPGALQQEGGHD